MEYEEHIANQNKGMGLTFLYFCYEFGMKARITQSDMLFVKAIIIVQFIKNTIIALGCH